MKSRTLILIFVFLFGVSHTEKEKEIGKVICSLKRLIQTDIYFGTSLSSNKVIFSKMLFQGCNFNVRIISNLNLLGKNDLITFAYQEEDVKVF